MVCLTGKSSCHRVSLRWLSTEVGKAIMGLWEPWASPAWAGGRQGRKECGNTGSVGSGMHAVNTKICFYKKKR